MALHLLRIVAIALAIVGCTFYRFLPGRYDELSNTLSAMAQAFGVAGLLLVPIGALWLTHEWRRRAPAERPVPARDRRYRFALASVIGASLVGAIVCLVAFASGGRAFGVMVTGLWGWSVFRLVRRVNSSKGAESTGFNPAPLYLLLIPGAVLLAQWRLAGPMTEFSRNRAIANSAALIDGIETHRRQYGRYPEFLAALWQDYPPSVVGIDRFQYARQGDAYSLFFEQPSLRLGTREIVMYNRDGEHVMPSHDTFLLRRTPDQLRTGAGWYAVNDGPQPHWKYFWFD